MKKEEYLQKEEVGAFTGWLGGKLDHTLYPRYKEYRWGGKDFTENQKSLDAYAEELKKSAQEGNWQEAQRVCIGILEWGRVTAHNVSKIKELEEYIIPYLQHAQKRLAAEELRGGDTFFEIELNSGFVKIYSLLMEKFLMYDGRVGAGLCYLVRKFCEESGRYEQVPDGLAFTFGIGRVSDAEKGNDARKNRDPGKGNYKFLNHEFVSPVKRVKRTIMANWLVEKVLENGCPAFDGEENLRTVSQKIRALEAALFMLGDDIKD